MGAFDSPKGSLSALLQQESFGGPEANADPDAAKDPSAVKKPNFRSTNAPRYEVVQEYEIADECISTSPGWVMAVIRLARPLTYSRRLNKSVGSPSSGAFLRQSQPLIIFDDCTQLSISRPTGQPLKNLN